MLVSVGIETWTKGLHWFLRGCHAHKTRHITEHFHTLIWLHFIWHAIWGTPSHIFIYLCLWFFVSAFLSLSLSSTKTHRHTPNLLPVLSASPQPLYKRSLFKGPMKLARGLPMETEHFNAATSCWNQHKQNWGKGGDKERNEEKDCEI